MLDSALDLKTGVLDPQGPVAAAERLILLNATTIMLAVIVPVIVLTVGIAWWFRAGNRRAKRLPEWSYSGAIELVVWSIPILVIMFLGGMAWIGSHDLHPRKPLAKSEGPPLRIQVVALDWKWLFIYPDQGLASIDKVVVPAGAALQFDLTSATVMNSFFVPQLGSQIYAMAGMATQVHLKADRPGSYQGLAAHYNGAGFSDMRFQVVAMTRPDFDAWAAKARDGAQPLDAEQFRQIARRSAVNGADENSSGGAAKSGAAGDAERAAVFSPVMPRLFEEIVDGDGALAKPGQASVGDAGQASVQTTKLAGTSPPRVSPVRKPQE